MFFRVKWLWPAMKGTSCAAGAGTIIWFDFVPALLLWLQGAAGSCVRAQLQAVLESVVVDRSGIALRVLPCCVALCGESCGFAM